jgi:transposase
MSGIFIGIDVHQKQSYYCAMDKRGSCLGHESISTDRKSLSKLIERYAAAGDVHVAIETGGSTWWVARVLKEMGADVHAVNTYELKLIAHSKRKTDKYDSKVLADLLRCDGLPERVHMPGRKTMELRSMLRTRKWLVRQRSQAITRAKAVMRQVGIAVKPRMFFTARSWEEVLGSHVDWEALIRPMYEIWTMSAAQAKGVEKQLKEILPLDEERMAILLTIPGVGPVTAWTMIACVEDIGRFKRADQLVAYAGMVPSEDSSGDRQRTGSMTRRGRSDLRDVYVQAAWATLRSSHPGTAYMKKFFYRIMHKKCSQIAIVALAKKLLVISYHMLKQRTPFAVDRHEAKAA